MIAKHQATVRACISNRQTQESQESVVQWASSQMMKRPFTDSVGGLMMIKK